MEKPITAQVSRVWNPHCRKSKTTQNIQELPEQLHRGVMKAKSRIPTPTAWNTVSELPAASHHLQKHQMRGMTKLCQVSRLSTNSTWIVKLELSVPSD